MPAPSNQWYHKKYDFDDMDLAELEEFFKDKRFFDYNCNCPQWNNALVRIRDKYGEVRPDPRNGFGLIHGLRRTTTVGTSSTGG